MANEKDKAAPSSHATQTAQGHPPHPEGPLNIPDVPAKKEEDTHEYDTPKDFKLAKPGEKDWVAGSPVDEAELKKVDEEHDKKLAEGRKQAEEAASKAKEKAAEHREKK